MTESVIEEAVLAWLKSTGEKERKGEKRGKGGRYPFPQLSVVLASRDAPAWMKDRG
jgi:hypothetical protein